MKTSQALQPSSSPSRALRRPDPQATGDGSVAPSVRAIFEALQGRKPMTGADIRAASGLPRRTVSSALQALRERGVLVERQSLRDARQKYFWLAGLAASSPDERSVADAGGPSAPPASAH